MNSASNLAQLPLFAKAERGSGGPVRTHIAIEDATLRRKVVRALSAISELSLVPGSFGHNAEVDVRVFSDVAQLSQAAESDSLPAPAYVLVAGDAGDDALLEALERGASAYVPAARISGDLAAALLRVAGGEVPLLEDIAVRKTVCGRLMEMVRRKEPQPEQAPEKVGMDNPFSPRERQIIRGIADGLTSHAIGKRLGLEGQTIKNYTTRIFAKTRTHKRAHAVAVASERGWLDSPNGDSPNGNSSNGK